jgi:hypothetical protein
MCDTSRQGLLKRTYSCSSRHDIYNCLSPLPLSHCCLSHPLSVLVFVCLLCTAPPIPRGKAVWKPQWDELKDFTDNEVIVSILCCCRCGPYVGGGGVLL